MLTAMILINSICWGITIVCLVIILKCIDKMIDLL